MSASTSASLPPRAKRKRNRPQLSCDFCRIAKLKCDRQKPLCSSCRAHGRGEDACTRNGVPLAVAPPPPTGRRRRPPLSIPPPQSETLPLDAAAATTAATTLASPQTCPSLAPSSPTRSLLHPPVVSSPQAAECAVGLRRFGPLSTTSNPDPWTPLANQARLALPPWEQMSEILQVYWDEVAVCFPWYDPGEIRAKAEALFALPEDRDLNSQQGGMLSLLAFLCAAAAKVYALSTRTRLLLWGAETAAPELTTLGRRCFHEGFVQVERNACPMRGCPIVQLQLVAGAGLSLLMLAGVLDPCLRAARQSHMDRLGSIALRNEVAPAGCFALLVYLDWWAAPAQGCHMVDERTFTTSWQDVPDTLLEGGFEAFAVWRTNIRTARLARRLGEGEHLPPEAVQEVLLALPDDLMGESVPALYVRSRLHFLLLGLYLSRSPLDNQADAAEQARALVTIGRTAKQAGHVLPRTHDFQHALFVAGLVLIADLVRTGASGEEGVCALDLLRDSGREHGAFSAARLEGYLRQALPLRGGGDIQNLLAMRDEKGVTVSHVLSDPFLRQGVYPYAL